MEYQTIAPSRLAFETTVRGGGCVTVEEMKPLVKKNLLS